MKQKGKKVNYTEEPDDDLKLPDNAEVLTRKQEGELGIPSPDELSGVEWERIIRGGKVILQSKRGGPRPGAGRKPKGNVRMQVLVSKTAKDSIRRIAKIYV